MLFISASTALFASSLLTQALAVPAFQQQAVSSGGQAAAKLANVASDEPGVSGRSNVDILTALQDKPRGEFFGLIQPLVEAVTINYYGVSGPEFDPAFANATISGGGWKRLVEVEVDLEQGGLHARAFVNHEARRGILTFRGICLENEHRQCQVDKCFLQSVRAFGEYSPLLFDAGVDCSELGDTVDYVAQADAAVRAMQAHLPGYALMLTGHSMGGALAIVTAARQPGVLQAVTFAPTAFNVMLADLLHFSEDQLAQLPSDDLIAIGDQYDCMINTVAVHQARQGSTTCLYETFEEPSMCEVQMKQSLSYSKLSFPKAIMCKVTTHQWSRYRQLILARGASQSEPAHLPRCDARFSTFQEPGSLSE